MRILLTRPEAPALLLKEKLEARGHEVALAPVLSIEPVEFSLDQAQLGGVVMTSASAAPALTSAGLAKDMVVYAIGGTSAEAARHEGFRNVISANGDRREFTGLIAAHHDPARGHLLHLAGSHHAGDIVAELTALGLKTLRIQVYEAVAASALPPHICNSIRGGKVDVILFFSPRSAEIFISLVASLPRDNGLGARISGISALCLSDAVAKAARPGGWKKIVVAGALNEVAMIEAVDGMNEAVN